MTDVPSSGWAIYSSYEGSLLLHLHVAGQREERHAVVRYSVFRRPKLFLVLDHTTQLDMPMLSR